MSMMPEGFKPLFRTSPFLEANGPFFYKEEGIGFVVALRIEEKHCNAKGFAHGGLLLTLADVALGYNTAFSKNPPLSMVTTSMSADFASSARIGDWVEARVEVGRVGQRVAFANAYLYVGEERIVRTSAVFTILAN